MRKIEEQMIRAIKTERTRMPSGNTQVCHAGSITEVHLHGHLIARRDSADANDSGWTFNLCGWNTPTTRSRINALAREFGHPGVFTKAGELFTGDYLTRTRVPTNGWF